jgi:undecaprenyl-diphosphatase
MEILALFFLGLVQGLTEFLPVSSSGHLVLLSKLFLVDESLFVSVILHCATLCSILVVFWKDIVQMVKHPLSKNSMLIVIATLPTCIICLALLPIIKSSFAGEFLPICFLVSAILLLISEKMAKKCKNKEISFKTALFMGVFQGFAAFSGISRSGSTISAGLLCGSKKEDVTRLSFLMSIPIILASLFMEILEIATVEKIESFSIFGLLLAFVTAFVVGVFSIKIMLKGSKKLPLWAFSVYLVAISILSLFVV